MSMRDVLVVSSGMDAVYLRDKPNTLTDVDITGASSTGIDLHPGRRRVDIAIAFGYI